MVNVDKLIQAVVEGDKDSAGILAKEAVVSGVDLESLVEKLTDAMRVVGDKFERFEIFLPEMMQSADAMMAAMDVIGPKLAEGGNVRKKGTVVIGSAAGDMHEIGKDIVITVLKANGFEIVDLGADVDPLEFVTKAKEAQADIIGISALMTTTMPGAAEVIELLKENGLRDKVKVMVGGAPTTQEWADSIGADGWAENASQAAELAEKLIG